MPDLTPDERRRIYLIGTGPRILENAVVSGVGDAAWFDMQVPGLLLRLSLTRQEVAELIAVLSGVEAEMREGDEGGGEGMMAEETLSLSTVIEITEDETSMRSVLFEMIKALKGPDGRCKSAEHTLAMRHLQEARFWLGEALFGGK